MKRLLSFVLLLTLALPGLVQACFEPPQIVGGVELQSIFTVEFEDGLIQDVYGDIYYGPYDANQIVCRANYIYEEDEKVLKLIPLVVWSVWYRPGLLVSKDAECIDTKKFPSLTDDWHKAGYRWLGSGVEPHPELIWLWQWKETKTLPSATFKWCRARKFSYVSYGQSGTGEASWGEIFQMALFDYSDAEESLGLVSRDVVCTKDIEVYSKWLKVPGWKFVSIGE